MNPVNLNGQTREPIKVKQRLAQRRQYQSSPPMSVACKHRGDPMACIGLSPVGKIRPSTTNLLY